MALTQFFREHSAIRKSLLIFGAWTLFGCYDAMQIFRIATAASPKPYSLGSALFSELTYAYTASTLTPLVLWLARRFPFEHRQWMRRLGCTWRRCCCSRWW